MNSILQKILPLTAILVVGIGIGWFSKPDRVRVEEKVKIVEVVKEVVVTQEKAVVQVVRVKDLQVAEKIHREKTETRGPDGTVVLKETEDHNIDSIVHEKENSTEVKVVETTKEVVVEKEKIVEKRSEPVLTNWRLALLGGLSPDFSSGLNIRTWNYGVEVEHRFMGPIFLGAWGLTGTDGRITAGLKAGMEF